MAKQSAFRICLCLLLTAILSSVEALNQTRSSRGTLLFTYSTNIIRVTIDHPPINLFDAPLSADFLDFLVSIQSTNTATPPKVVVIDSADPDFFISHVDLSLLVAPLGPATQTLFTQLGAISALLRNTTTTVFIAEIDGRTSGYGDEVLLQTDIRFAGPNARASQLETSFGLFPAGGGDQALPRLINRGRALQYILSGEAVNGAKGAALGWFNEHFNSSQTLEKEVDKLAKRIALNPAGGLNATKAALPELYPPQNVYDRDTELFIRETLKPEMQALIKKGLVLSKNQTRSQFELDIPYSLIELSQ